ncbi:FAD-dependent oxidoreductase [Lacticaseibacillus thailandensis]|uniref:FAD-dependent oxidoreductase n=1 Tax=Lacticaseibacillus thailandensis TaxID=381741 RepID=UPI0034E1EFD8
MYPRRGGGGEGRAHDHPEAEVVVYERDDNVSFLSCGVALYLGGEVKNLDEMFYENPAHLRTEGIDVRDKHDVLRIDSDKHTLTIQNLRTTEVFTDTYDKLIMTTGSNVVVPPVMGVDDTRVLMCKDARQAQAIFDSAQNHHHVYIVGGGYVGVELAEAYANTDHAVTLLQAHNQLLNRYIDEELSAQVERNLQEHGVDLQLNTRVDSFESDDDHDQVLIHTNGADFHAGLVIVCAGFVPNTELLRGQVKLDARGAIITNDWLETSNPDILAAGDTCAVRFNPTGKLDYIPLATNAERQGRIAGRNAFGHVQKYPGTQGTTALRLFSETLATTGLTSHAAAAAGVHAASVIYRDNYRPVFMQPNAQITIKLVYNVDDHRVLGAQLLCAHDISQTANTVSLAIQNGNTIEDLAYVDTLFNPHYDQPVNYLNQVALLAVAQTNA